MSQTPEIEHHIAGDSTGPERESGLAASGPPTQPTLNIGSVQRLLGSGAALLGIGLCVLLAALGLAIGGGYVAGQTQRNTSATQTTIVELDLQFQLAVEDMAGGRYGLAVQRLEWILTRDPDYPGAAERLIQSRRFAGQANATSLPVSPTAIPPSEAKTLEERFQEARTLYENDQLDAAILRLQELQAIDSTFREAEVQQLLYDALVELGLRYVRSEDRLEEGIILLNQAKAIKPLEDQVEGERLLATFYITSETYWGLDWSIVIRNLAEIYAVAPNYHDVSDRLWEAHVNYGNQLAQGGAPCEATEQYDEALTLRDDAEIEEKASAAQEACLNLTATPLTPTDTPDGTGTPEAAESTTEPTSIPTDTVTPTTASTMTPTP